jgi:hypothetical protein
LLFKLLDNGKLDDTETKSEYERGYVDCWNKFCFPMSEWEIQENGEWVTHPLAVEELRKNFPEIFC